VLLKLINLPPTIKPTMPNTNPLTVEVYRGIVSKKKLEEIPAITHLEELAKYSGIELRNEYSKTELRKCYLNQLLYFKKSLYDDIGEYSTNLRLDETLGTGFGLVAKGAIRKGTVIRIFGYWSKREDVNGLFPRLEIGKEDPFVANRYHSMDGTLSFVNHGCIDRRNCEYIPLNLPQSKERSTIHQSLAIFYNTFRIKETTTVFSLKAIQEIKQGEELLVHYGDKPPNCQCCLLPEKRLRNVLSYKGMC
jgi:hypothetical protein